jgi:hypothetical protein
VLFVVLCATPAAAQTIGQVLSFLLTNRSISTGDFTRDEQAAAATRDAMGAFLLNELTTFPTTSPAGGFTYRLDPALGTNVRSSDSFGPFFTERSLTVGRRHGSLTVSYGQASFDTLDGRALRNGTLVAIASQLHGESQPFDVETLTLRIQTRTTTVTGQFGVTDRIDIGVAVPFVRIDLSGSRVDTLRATAFPEASAVAAASGLGDTLIRAKFNALRSGGSGLAFGCDVRLPTGDTENFLGSGDVIVIPHVIASVEHDRVSVHGDVGYSTGGPSNELDYGGAATVVAGRRLTFVAEAVGRHLASAGDLVYVTEPRPGLVGVDTIRLTSTNQSTTRLSVVAGIRWNVGGRWLLSASVLRPITTVGLNARWVPTMTVDYSFGR